MNTEEADIREGDLLARIRSVIGEYRERVKKDEKKGQYGGASLGDFAQAIFRLEDAADVFEHGEVVSEADRVPYKNEVRVSSGGSREVIESHESFGTVKFTRVSGGARLFGSHLDSHHHFINLAIGRCSRHRTRSRDWIYGGRKDLIEVSLSAAQFAEAITSMNMGSGTPCTIGYVNGVRMDRVPESSQAEHHMIRDEFKAEIEVHKAAIEEALADFDKILATGKTISKGRAKEMRDTLSRATRKYNDSAPFVLESFRKSAEKVVASSKAEIDGFLTMAVQNAGIESLRYDTKTLPASASKLLTTEVKIEDTE